MENGNAGITSSLYVWNGISMFWGTSFHTDPHLHNTLQLVFDMDRSFKLKDAAMDWASYKTAIIRAGHMHQLDSDKGIQLFIYLDADSYYAKALTDKYLADCNIASLEGGMLRKLSTDFFKKLLVKSDCESLLAGCKTIFDQLITLDPPKTRDERVLKAIDFVKAEISRPLKVKDIADHVCLSESRLRHLFKEQVGQPIQSFLLWMRVVDSLNMVLQGKQVSQSAIDAGFWDGSHMNRSYMELLGIAPSKVKIFEKNLRIVACGSGSFHTLRTEIRDSWQANADKQIIEI